MIVMRAKSRCYEHITVESVKVLGTPCGNLWWVMSYGVPVAKVSYFDNTLTAVWGEMPCSRATLERKIEELYQEAGK